MSDSQARRPPFEQALTAAAAERRERDQLRQLQPLRWRADGLIDGPQGPLVDFCSNDYLGLARDRQQAQVLAQAATDYGVGAGSAHAVCGHHPEHAKLERSLADWLQRPRALLFSSGWSAALGALDALLGRHDLCVQDRLNHACLLDGARLAQARLLRYPHADHSAAESLLASSHDRRALLVTDGLFSMDGDYAPMAELAAVCARQGAWLMVDEAHALGVTGPHGSGSAVAAGLGADQVPVLMGTFGKALGGFGAFIAGSDNLIECLIHQARPHLFTTAMPPAWAACMASAVQRVSQAEDLRHALALRIARFRTRAQALGLRTADSISPIQLVLLDTESRALAWASALADDGFAVKAIRPPTVPAGQSRLRITLNVNQPLAAIDTLLESLARLQDGERSSPLRHAS